MAKVTEEELMKLGEDFKREVDLINLRYTSYLSMLARYVEEQRTGKKKVK